MNRERTAIDVESLLIWAFRDELSKRGLSSAEAFGTRLNRMASAAGSTRATAPHNAIRISACLILMHY
jgi:hypothetical protein